MRPSHQCHPRGHDGLGVLIVAVLRDKKSCLNYEELATHPGLRLAVQSSSNSAALEKQAQEGLGVPQLVASLALGSYRHISMSAHAMSAHESRTPTEPWEWEEEGSELICLPSIDVQGQDQ